MRKPTNLTPGVTLRYHFEDEGQDLTYVDIRNGVIVGAGVTGILDKIFTGQLCYDTWANIKLKKGGFIRFSKSPNDSIEKFKYRIAKIEELVVTEDHKETLTSLHEGVVLSQEQYNMLPVMTSLGLVDANVQITKLGKDLLGIIEPKLSYVKMPLSGRYGLRVDGRHVGIIVDRVGKTGWLASHNQGATASAPKRKEACQKLLAKLEVK